MRLLLISNLFPTPADPVRGVFTQQLASALSRRCDLRVVVPLPWFPPWAWVRHLMPRQAQEFGFAGPTARWGDVQAQYLRYPLIPKISERLHPWLMRHGIAAAITAMHRREPIELINAQWLYPDGVAATIVARRLGIPVVLTGLGCDINDFLDQPEKRQPILDALHACDAVTAVSSGLAERLLAEGIDAAKVSVIANGVDTGRFCPQDQAEARRRLGLPPDARMVVCVARLSPEKGAMHLLSATPRVKAAVPNVRIIIVGDGPEAPALRAQATALGIGDIVHFAGKMAHERIPDWLSAADVACLPSIREGHPNAAIEALASGRPVVASRVGGLSETITPTRGLLVPAADPGQLAAALIEALRRSWDVNHIAASMAGYGWATAAERYLEIFARHASKPVRHAAVTSGLESEAR